MPENYPITNELWKPIIGFEGWYEVSNHGRIRRSRRGQGARIGKILVPSPNRGGYLSVKLSKNTVKTTVSIHQAVMAAFVGPCPEGYEVNHKFGIKTDNRYPESLEYVTTLENHQHAAKMGLTSRGEDMWKSKLKVNDIKAIRQDSKTSAKSKAAAFGVTIRTIYDILERRTWKHVD